mgnify:CR=1 FL=1
MNPKYLEAIKQFYFWKHSVRLSPKMIKIFVYMTLSLVLVSGLGFQHFVSPKKDRADVLKLRLVQEKEYRQKLSYYQNAEHIQNQDKEKTEPYLKHIFEKDEDYMAYINRHFINQSPLKKESFLKIQYRPNKQFNSDERKLMKDSQFSKANLELELIGNYQSFQKYLAHIQSIPLLFSIEKLNIRRAKKEVDTQLQLSLSLSFYFIK